MELSRESAVPENPASSGNLQTQRDNNHELPLLEAMQEITELNKTLTEKVEDLEKISADVELVYKDMRSKREGLERELLDWKNFLIQKVEGCYTRVLGQLLESFKELEDEAMLNREYTSNLLWSTNQISSSAKNSLNCPDLDQINIMREQLQNRITDLKEIDGENLVMKNDAVDWTFVHPSINDGDIWKLMGYFVTPNKPRSQHSTKTQSPLNIDSNTSSSNQVSQLQRCQNLDSFDENLNFEPSTSPEVGRDLIKVPQLVTSFQTMTATDGSRCHPLSITATSSNDIIIADKHNKKIKVFTTNGHLKREISHEKLQAPVYVEMTPDGNIAVCDRKDGSIKVFSLEGKLLDSFPKLCKSPGGLAFTSTGDLIVSDTGRKAILVVSFMAKAVKSVVKHFEVPLQGSCCKQKELTHMQWPHHVSVTSGDVIIVSDKLGNNIQFLDVSGKNLGQYGRGGKGRGQLQSPYGIGVDESGYIYVCDYGNDCIQVLSPGGKWEKQLLLPQDGLQHPSSMRWLGTNLFATTEHVSGLVKVYKMANSKENICSNRPQSPEY